MIFLSNLCVFFYSRKLNVIRIYMYHVVAVSAIHVFANQKNPKRLNGKESYFYFLFL